MKEATKVLFVFEDIDIKSKELDLNIDAAYGDTYAVVTPVKNYTETQESER